MPTYQGLSIETSAFSCSQANARKQPLSSENNQINNIVSIFHADKRINKPVKT